MAKSLAASYWKLHKKPAGKDSYGAPDPAFAKQPPPVRAEEPGFQQDQWGGGADPWDWKLHKEPAGKDGYGAPDPAFAKQLPVRAEEPGFQRGQGGGGADPRAARLANGYEEDMRKARENIQHLERAVADLELRLGAHEHEEAGSRMGFQTGGRAWGCSEGGAGAQRDDAGQCQPVHAQNGGGDPAQVEDELSTMS